MKKYLLILALLVGCRPEQMIAPQKHIPVWLFFFRHDTLTGKVDTLKIQFK